MMIILLSISSNMATFAIPLGQLQYQLIHLTSCESKRNNALANMQNTDEEKPDEEPIV